MAVLGSNQNIVSVMKSVISDAEEILRETVEASGEKAVDLRQRIAKELKAAKAGLADAESALRAKAKIATSAADECVRKNPWSSIGIAAGIGVLVGIFLVRK